MARHGRRRARKGGGRRATRAIRRGIVDVWNAFMVQGASFGAHDIPFCPTTAKSIPRNLMSWPEAKRIHRRECRRGNGNYHIDAFVHFYVDDFRFDGPMSSIWLFPWRALRVLKHFEGVITPDFSICQDFPEPLKLFNVYRMRAFGYWLGRQGLEVINNVRWGTEETWHYCFLGIPENSVVAIGTVASGLRRKANRPLFEEGFDELIRVVKPRAIIVYGSARYAWFKTTEEKGIEIKAFPSETSIAFKGAVRDEQGQ